MGHFIQTFNLKSREGEQSQKLINTKVQANCISSEHINIEFSYHYGKIRNFGENIYNANHPKKKKKKTNNSNNTNPVTKNITVKTCKFQYANHVYLTSTCFGHC